MYHPQFFLRKIEKTPAVIDEHVKACILSNSEFHGIFLLELESFL